MNIARAATTKARENHAAGVRWLNELFHFNPDNPLAPRAKHSRPKARRLSRKAARHARRLNRR
jgi:hypothetical protein